MVWGFNKNAIRFYEKIGMSIKNILGNASKLFIIYCIISNKSDILFSVK